MIGGVRVGWAAITACTVVASQLREFILERGEVNGTGADSRHARLAFEKGSGALCK